VVQLGLGLGIRIRYSVWLVSGNSHVFVLLSAVIVTLPVAAGQLPALQFSRSVLVSASHCDIHRCVSRSRLTSKSCRTSSQTSFANRDNLLVYRLSAWVASLQSCRSVAHIIIHRPTILLRSTLFPDAVSKVPSSSCRLLQACAVPYTQSWTWVRFCWPNQSNSARVFTT